MNDYVAKPVRADELARALKRVRPLPRRDDPRADEPQVTLDASALENLRELGGDGFVSEVVETFLADAPTLLSTLRQALENKSADELRRAAHTLKSNGATLGAEQFATLCRELEQRARNGELDDASELVGRIEDEYELFAKALGALGPAATA
jgi:HPt (histidine-containing phosphotransfer) domain-containing protein